MVNRSDGPESELALPAIVVAARQTAGRGRLGRSWYSDGGTLTFSIILDRRQVTPPKSQWSQLALVAGLAIADLLGDLVAPHHVKLKWPNDVYVRNKKVAGVLIETAGASADVAVLGVGLNVATDFSGASELVQHRATSIVALNGTTLQTFDVLAPLVHCFRSRIMQWAADAQAMIAAYRSACLLTGVNVTLQSGEQQIQGMCQGVDSNGRLQISATDGQHVTVTSGEVVDWKD